MKALIIPWAPKARRGRPIPLSAASSAHALAACALILRSQPWKLVLHLGWVGALSMVRKRPVGSPDGLGRRFCLPLLMGFFKVGHSQRFVLSFLTLYFSRTWTNNPFIAGRGSSLERGRWGLVQKQVVSGAKSPGHIERKGHLQLGTEWTDPSSCVWWAGDTGLSKARGKEVQGQVSVGGGPCIL